MRREGASQRNLSHLRRDLAERAGGKPRKDALIDHHRFWKGGSAVSDAVTDCDHRIAVKEEAAKRSFQAVGVVRLFREGVVSHHSAARVLDLDPRPGADAVHEAARDGWRLVAGAIRQTVEAELDGARARIEGEDMRDHSAAIAKAVPTFFQCQ